MKIEFLGVGEAFDPDLGNTSILIHAETKLLVDCGYAIPRPYFAKKLQADFLDAIYLTHCHADHTFGVPALLTRLYEEGRTKPLTFIGQPGTEAMVERLLEFGYPGIRKHFKYEVRCIDAAESVQLNELSLTFAPTSHSVPNFAIRVSNGKRSVGVSGDGAATEASIKLFAECDTLVHESFKAQELVWGHASAEQVVTFSRDLGKLRRLALVHLQRDQRRLNRESFLAFQTHPGCKVEIPEPGDVWD